MEYRNQPKVEYKDTEQETKIEEKTSGPNIKQTSICEEIWTEDETKLQLDMLWVTCVFDGRVDIALDNDDKYEIREMFRNLLEQNIEYEERIMCLEQVNASLRDVITTTDNAVYAKHAQISLLEQNNMTEMLKSPEAIDDATVDDMLTPIMTATPIQTCASPIYGIDL